MTTTNPSNERKMVLEMLAAGKISVEDAQRLLAKLDEVESARPDDVPSESPSKKRPKHLRIVAADEEDEVNLRIPLGLVRAGLALDSFLPNWAQSKIYVGTNLSEVTKLDSEYLRENLDDLDMTFDSDDGDSLRIFTE